jgi:hypothetical protein
MVWHVTETVRVTRSATMSTIQIPSTVLQKATCMLLSLIIVGTTLTAGMLGADRAAQPRYSVTITQLS